MHMLNLYNLVVATYLLKDTFEKMTPVFGEIHLPR
jgi:hypothetical protein